VTVDSDSQETSRTLRAGAGGTSWGSNEYELDFTTEASLDIDAAGDGSITLDSKTWTAEAMIYTSDFQVINGTGLKMTNTGTRHWESTTTSRGPNIHILISDLVAAYVDSRQVVDLQLLLANDTFTLGFAQAVFGICDPTTLPGDAGSDALLIKAGFDNGGVEEVECTRLQNNALSNDSSGPLPGAKTRVMGLRLLNPNQVEVYYSTDAADYQTAFSGGSWASAKDTNTLLGFNMAATTANYLAVSTAAVVVGKAGNRSDQIAHAEKLWVKVWDVLE